MPNFPHALDLPGARLRWYVAALIYGLGAALFVAFCCAGGAA